jgi:cytochrome c
VFPDEAQLSCAGEGAAGEGVIFDLGVQYGIDRADGESYQQFAGARAMSVKRRRFLQSLTTSVLLGVSALASANDAPSTALGGDPVHGKALYQACAACHSIDENDLGPKHRGVFGRSAGSVADYSYSAALKTSGLRWDTSTLDRWLANPSQLVPGTKMYFKIDDSKSRADVIAYLEQLK